MTLYTHVSSEYLLRHQADCGREGVPPALLRVFPVRAGAGQRVREQGRGILLRGAGDMS